MVESIRKDERSVLLLDCGAVFDHQRDAAELSLKAMALMGYDALNLAGPEFNFGKEFLEHARAYVMFPYIASNLLFEGSRPSWIREYIIQEVGGIKVAILGVLNPDGLAQLHNQEQVKDLQVIPPEAALNRLLPEVRGKADLVVLLSGLGSRETEALVKAVQGIDVAISSGSDDPLLGGTPKNTILLHTGYLGRSLGLLKVTLDEKRTLSVTDEKHIHLGHDVPDNAEIAGLVGAFKKTREKEAADLAKKQWEKTHKERMEVLQLSPEEFMERYRKEQTEKTKGEAR
jgi:5'-nucleotidase/UDP-sugar diphosphatase